MTPDGGRTDGEERGAGADDGEPLVESVERTYTCTVCGYGTRETVAPLQGTVQGTCVECGDWTVSTADPGALVEAARDVAATLSGPVLTERQALAYLLREAVDLGRTAAAEAMDTSASNVDNLQRRGAQKVAEAHRVLDTLTAAQGTNRPSVES